MNSADFERRLQGECGLLMAENERLRQRCAFPSCVNGEKPAWCGNCGDAVRADAAEAENERLRGALRYIEANCRTAQVRLAAKAALGEQP